MMTNDKLESQVENKGTLKWSGATEQMSCSPKLPFRVKIVKKYFGALSLF